MNENNARVRVSCIVVVCMLGFVAVSCIVPSAEAETIDVSTDMPPLNTERLAAGTVLGDDGRIYVFGGFRYNYTTWDTTTNTVLIYNITMGSTANGNVMSGGLAWPSCAKLPDGRIAVIGGYNSVVNNGTKTVRIYTPSTDSWTTNASAPVNISKASTVLGKDGKIYLFGAVNHENSTLIYDPVSDAWSFGADLSSSSRTRHWTCAVAYNQTAVYIIGGFRVEKTWVAFPSPGYWSYSFINTNYVDIYNPVADSWTVGPPLNTAKFAGGAALVKDGSIHYYGGMQFAGTVRDEIETLDVSSSGATWHVLDCNISKKKSNFGTVTDDHGRAFLVGGLDSSFTGISDVEMLVTAEVSEVNEIAIVSPADGAEVNGTVEITVEAKNQHNASVVVVDAYVDDELLESQLGGGATAWTFAWNTSGFALDSTHDVLVRAFFSDGSVSEDEATYVIAPASATIEDLEERLNQIDINITSLMDDISDLASSIADLMTMMTSADGNVSDLASDLQSVLEDISFLQADLDAIAEALAELESATGVDLAALSSDMDALADTLVGLVASVAELQTALDELAQQPGVNLDEVTENLDSLMDAIEGLNQTINDVDESVSETQGTSDDARLYALMAMALALVVVAVLALGMVVLRRKAQD